MVALLYALKPKYFITIVIVKLIIISLKYRIYLDNQEDKIIGRRHNEIQILPQLQVLQSNISSMQDLAAR